ncbi:hypothetical protein GQ600_16104 [Phytophthora cactorum]|nr:hypothetical protein GQ600_16104 [Phytophthora cactorum]
MNWPSQGLDDQVEEFKPISEAAVQDEIATGIEPSDALELHILHGQPLCEAPWFIQDDDDLRSIFRPLQETAQDRVVSKELQSKSVSIADVRSYFDALIELWPEFATYLGPRAAIVHNPHFEAGCVKVQRGESAELTRSEKAALSQFAVLEASNSHSPLTTRRRDRSSNRSKRSARLRPQRLPTCCCSPPPPPLQTRWSAFSVWPRPPSAFNGSASTSYTGDDFVPSHERRTVGRERRQRVLLDWLLVKLLLLYC